MHTFQAVFGNVNLYVNNIFAVKVSRLDAVATVLAALYCFHPAALSLLGILT